MKLLRASSSIALALLLMASSYVAASALQHQVERERELRIAVITGNGLSPLGGGVGFSLNAQNRRIRPFGTQHVIVDPIIIDSFGMHSGNPARDGFIGNPARDGFMNNPARNGFMNNPARGGFMTNAPIRR
ncbi:hypothetical protein CJP72_19720 [Citrobacter sp. NCU1]|uniref:hypothetical protein n=1 Tax=Citrobacter sp. NCU1 TaxID=2026683 RepID=UPI0013911989|nr:hypothetical protein [Citrobacter sp. NCU1]NDO82916.1 hypothetical protein [Citrobacter sp. NCU1]